MKLVSSNSSIVRDALVRNSTADRRILIDAVTLIALGLSVLFLNSWDTSFVRTSVGLFWGAFFLSLNWSSLVSAFRSPRQENDTHRRISE
jgi:hypothetical protein